MGRISMDIVNYNDISHHFLMAVYRKVVSGEMIRISALACLCRAGCAGIGAARHVRRVAFQGFAASAILVGALPMRNSGSGQRHGINGSAEKP